MNAWLIRHYFTVIHQVSEGHFERSIVPNTFALHMTLYRSLSHTHKHAQKTKTTIQKHTRAHTKKCHPQLKDDSPVGKEEEVCEPRPVHPDEDVGVVGDLQLLQKGNIPENKRHQSPS